MLQGSSVRAPGHPIPTVCFVWCQLKAWAGILLWESWGPRAPLGGGGAGTYLSFVSLGCPSSSLWNNSVACLL
jgi:hypothetical protein